MFGFCSLESCWIELGAKIFKTYVREHYKTSSDNTDYEPKIYMDINYLFFYASASYINFSVTILIFGLKVKDFWDKRS